MASGSSAAGNVDLNTISTVVAGVLTSLQSTSLVNREYGLVNREYGLVNRDYGLVNRDYGLVNRDYGLVNRDYGLLNREPDLVNVMKMSMHRNNPNFATFGTP